MKKGIQNSLLDITERIAQLKQESASYKASIQDIDRADYNLRENLYTLRWVQLSYRYATDGIFNTLIKQPVLDALRNGIKITSEQLSKEEIEMLDEAMNKKNIINTVKQLFIWNRLYGGSGLIIEISGQPMADEMIIENLPQGSKVNYYAVNRWELSNNSIKSGNQIENENYAQLFNDEIYYYSDKINKSKLILLNGVEAPQFVKQILSGWGLSVAEPLVAPSNIYQKSVNLIYQLIDQAKLDVYQIEGLKESVASGGDKYIIDQIQLTNILKNYENALVLDKNDTHEQRQLQLTGIVDIIKELKLDICSAVRIPAVILWGMSPSGFSSGEFDLKSYYSGIESELRPEIKNVIMKILKIESQALFGVIPDDIDFDYNSLLIQTEEQIQNSKDKQFNRLIQLYQNKLITKAELFDALKIDNIFTGKVKASSLDEYAEGQETQDELDFGGGSHENTPGEM